MNGSWMSREVHVQFWERVGVKLPCATHLLPIFDTKLHFPKEFVGRGDLSRGGLLLRSVTANRLLTHIPVAGTVLQGSRQPKLTPLPGRCRTAGDEAM
jgi:hypothetical protein